MISRQTKFCLRHHSRIKGEIEFLSFLFSFSCQHENLQESNSFRKFRKEQEMILEEARLFNKRR